MYFPQYHSSLASLNGLEAHLGTTAPGGPGPQGSYSFAHFDCIQNTLTSEPLTPHFCLHCCAMLPSQFVYLTNVYLTNVVHLEVIWVLRLGFKDLQISLIRILCPITLYANIVVHFVSLVFEWYLWHLSLQPTCLVVREQHKSVPLSEPHHCSTRISLTLKLCRRLLSGQYDSYRRGTLVFLDSSI